MVCVCLYIYMYMYIYVCSQMKKKHLLYCKKVDREISKVGIDLSFIYLLRSIFYLFIIYLYYYYY